MTFSGKPKRDRYIEPREFEALLAAAKRYDADAYAFLRTLGATGVRGVEAEWLTVADVDYVRGGIWVKTAKRKGNPVRFVGIDQETLSLLRAHIGKRKSGPVFYWLKKPLVRSRQKRLFKSYARAAKIRPALSVHCLRHFHITACAEMGIGPHEIAARVGHSNTSMIMEYFTLREERNREFGDRLEKYLFKGGEKGS